MLSSYPGLEQEFQRKADSCAETSMPIFAAVMADVGFSAH